MRKIIRFLKKLFRTKEEIVERTVNMTTKEFIQKKNRIVKDATGVLLVPENQIIDEPRVQLMECGVSALHGGLCPYCCLRKENIEPGMTRISCETCPMALANNKCEYNVKKSTWDRANDIWEKEATAKDKQDLLNLIKEYNKEY